MSKEEDYKSLLKKFYRLKKEVEELKFYIDNNKREFSNIQYVNLDISRGIKCRKDLNYGGL